MSREFYSLLHKEWVERRSMFRLGIIFVIGLLGYCVAYEIEYRTRTFIASYYHTCIIFAQLGSVLLAMIVATGEYAQRTLKFSASLPISLSKVAWSRLLAAWGLLVVPMLIGAVVTTLLLATGLIEQAGLRSEVVRLTDRSSLSRIEAIGFLWTTVAVAIACALQLVSLLSLLGTRCRSEGTVGLVGTIVVLFTQMFTAIRPSLERAGLFNIADWIGSLIPNSMLISWGYGELDGSTHIDLDLAPLVVGPLVLNLLITLVLAFWFAHSYGRRMDSVSLTVPKWRRWIPALPNFDSKWPKHWRSEMAALVWLNARQSIPLSLAGLMIAALFGVVDILQQLNRGISIDQMRGSLVENTWSVGLFWAALVAVSVFGSELKPNLEQFWRSRPISPARWFWIKFAVGLIAVLGALDGIPALIAWNAPYPHTSGRMGFVNLACMPFLHAQVYATAVAAICQFRRPIPAAMVGLLLFFMTDAVMQSNPYHNGLSTLQVYNSLNAAQVAGEKLDLTSAGYPIVYGIVFAVILLATMLARRSIVPSRVGSLVLLAATALGVLSSNRVQGNDRTTTDEIIAGIQAREAIVKESHIRFKLQRHRTDAYYQSQATNQPRQLRPQRPAQLRIETPQEEELDFELFERAPLRAWTTFGPNGIVKSVAAFDGTMQRDYSVTANHTGQGTIMASTQPLRVPIPVPESSLMSCGGTPLMQYLEGWNGDEIVHRTVNGEKLIDLTFSNQLKGVDGSPSAVAHDDRFHVTINASRNYWPIRVRSEFADSPGGLPFSTIDVKADGWIEAGSIVYPRRIEQTNYVSSSFAAIPSKAGNSTATPTKPEKTETQVVEITDLEINSGFSEDVFRPPFPPGALIWDRRDSKYYEADATGVLKLHVARPKGIRGAVFCFHIIWISLATTWLFFRRAGS